MTNKERNLISCHFTTLEQNISVLSFRWLTFTDRCKYHTALLVYKTLNHMAPSYMSDIITVSTNNSYSLRSALRNDLVLKHKPKTKYIKDSFNYYSME